jgi:hypothetical protein
VPREDKTANLLRTSAGYTQVHTNLTDIRDLSKSQMSSREAQSNKNLQAFT